jgi:hypothetical protein
MAVIWITRRALPNRSAPPSVACLFSGARRVSSCKALPPTSPTLPTASTWPTFPTTLSAGESRLFIAGVDGSAPRKLATRKITYPSGSYLAVHWSPDGRRIAATVSTSAQTGQFRGLIEVHVATGREQPIASRPWRNVNDFTWFPDGSGLLLAAQERTGIPSQLWIVSYPDGKARRVSNDLSEYYSASLSADGSTSPRCKPTAPAPSMSRPPARLTRPARFRLRQQLVRRRTLFRAQMSGSRTPVASRTTASNRYFSKRRKCKTNCSRHPAAPGTRSAGSHGQNDAKLRVAA